ncbi:NCS2 family permease [Calidifontibacter indicus]|uniref:AGZA family xanthine/uracil permease-like MFS transporter n=1 Tax=Calidifontibacter indicus TaxID=419650 RepID=A0A3D9UQ57_9MICO|nr:NCS2 family permease [Calidifontibacter indicus]REF30120.1 AGZA family xanthine/uracil permease-like MFS transporter [Calidifontibacter indicus]
MSTSAPPAAASGIDRFFKISERGSTVSREVRGGFVTFFTMAYIIALNPLILGFVKDGTGQFLGGGPGDGSNLSVIAACTALVAGVMSIAMGMFANFPMSIAAGLGLNAFVAYGVAALPDMTWQAAMGLVVWEGILILLLVVSGFRVAAFRALPQQMKTAISVGIGMFIAFIGVFDSGFSRAGSGTPVQLGVDGRLQGWPIVVFIFGFLLLVALSVRKVTGAMLIAIVSATVLAIIIEAVANIGPRTVGGKETNPRTWSLNVPTVPDTVVQTPDFSLVGHVDMFGGFAKAGVIAAVLIIFSLVLADFFDTMGTMTAIGAKADLLDKDGIPADSQKILVVDSVAAAAGGLGGVSSNTAYIESAAGVGDGARTGLASVVTGVLFLLATFAAPLVEVIPHEAAAPALVFVGFLMMQEVGDIDWRDIEIALPAFLTIALMPFTYSITVGIGVGTLTYLAIKVIRGKWSQIPVVLWIISACFALYFAIDPIRQVFGVN